MIGIWKYIQIISSEIHASRDDFENLKDGSWVEGVILNCFMEIMSQNMGWG